MFIKTTETNPEYIYYATVYKDAWEQPVLTSNTSYGTITYSSAQVAAYHISDGNLGTSSYSYTWESGTTSGWVNWALPETIAVTNIKVYQRYCISSSSDYTETVTIQTDSDGDILLDSAEMEHANGAYVEWSSDTPVFVNNLYFYITGQNNAGIGEVVITARKGSLVIITEDLYNEVISAGNTLAKTITTYYKEVEEDWEQPVLYANGTVGSDDFAVGYSSTRTCDGNYYPFRATDPDNYGWSASARPTQYLTYYVDKGIKLSGITFKNYAIYYSEENVVSQYVIYGSNDDSTYTELCTCDNEHLTKDEELYSFDIETEDYYKYIRISCTACAGSGGFPAIGYAKLSGTVINTVETDETDYTSKVEDVWLYTNVKKYITTPYILREYPVPALTSNGTAGGTSFAISASEANSSYPAYNLLNIESDTYWHSSSTSGSYDIILYVPFAGVIKNFTVYNRTEDTSASYKLAANSVTVSISADGSSYQTLLTHNNTVGGAGENWTVDLESHVQTFWLQLFQGEASFKKVFDKGFYIKLNFKSNSYLALNAIDFDLYKIWYSSSNKSGDFKSVGEVLPLYYTPVKNGKNYHTVKQKAIYLNWVPWTMPNLESNGTIFNLSKDVNYGAYASTEDGGAAYEAFALNIDTGWVCTRSDETPYVVFHSPTPLRVKYIGLSSNSTADTVTVLLSSDGKMFQEATTVTCTNTAGTACCYNGSTLVCAHPYQDVQAIKIPEEYQIACQYIALKFTKTDTYATPCITALIFADQLATADWTDNEMSDWECPELTSTSTTTDDGNITVLASSECAGYFTFAPLRGASETFPYHNTASSTWQTGKAWLPDSETEAFWFVQFPYKIAITGLTHTNYTPSTDTDRYAVEGQFFADVDMTVPIGEAFTNSDNNTVTVFSDTSYIVTNTIFFRKTGGGELGGIGRLGITAKKLSLTTLDAESAKYVVSTSAQLPSNEESSGGLFTLLLQILVAIAVIGATWATAGGAAAGLAAVSQAGGVLLDE